MKPGSHLFGFKLLSGAAYDELIKAAYEIVLESGATAVFANDAKDLQTIYVVTKERGIHKIGRQELPEWIRGYLANEYYSSKEYTGFVPPIDEYQKRFDDLRTKFVHKFKPIPEGYTFGTIAIRVRTNELYNGFFTTGRGKHEITEPLVYVNFVDHLPNGRIVYIPKGNDCSF